MGRRACFIGIWILVIGLVLQTGEWGVMAANSEKATFGAGCFWGVEKVFGKLDGVLSTSVGYLGGYTKDPSYEEICTGNTGHAEVVEVVYDPAKIRYEDLLSAFWLSHNPTTLNQQGNDRGTQYRSAIFYHNDEQKVLAEKSKVLLQSAGVFKDDIVTEITATSDYYIAENYHQQYLKKNPNGYCSLQMQSPKVKEVLATL